MLLLDAMSDVVLAHADMPRQTRLATLDAALACLKALRRRCRRSGNRSTDAAGGDGAARGVGAAASGADGGWALAMGFEAVGVEGSDSARAEFGAMGRGAYVKVAIVDYSIEDGVAPLALGKAHAPRTDDDGGGDGGEEEEEEEEEEGEEGGEDTDDDDDGEGAAQAKAGAKAKKASVAGGLKRGLKAVKRGLKDAWRALRGKKKKRKGGGDAALRGPKAATPKKRFVQVSRDGRTLRWGWHQFLDLHSLHAVRQWGHDGRPPTDGPTLAHGGGGKAAAAGAAAAAAAADASDEGPTLQLWAGSVVEGFRVVTLHFGSRAAAAHAAWARGLCGLLRARLATRGLPAAATRAAGAANDASPLDGSLQAIFDAIDLDRTRTLSLHQATRALAAAGHPLPVWIIPTLLEHLSPLRPARSLATLSGADFIAVVSHLKSSLLAAHVANAQVRPAAAATAWTGVPPPLREGSGSRREECPSPR